MTKKLRVIKEDVNIYDALQHMMNHGGVTKEKTYGKSRKAIGHEICVTDISPIVSLTPEEFLRIFFDCRFDLLEEYEPTQVKIGIECDKVWMQFVCISKADSDKYRCQDIIKEFVENKYIKEVRSVSVPELDYDSVFIFGENRSKDNAKKYNEYGNYNSEGYYKEVKQALESLEFEVIEEKTEKKTKPKVKKSFEFGQTYNLKDIIDHEKYDYDTLETRCLNANKLYQNKQFDLSTIVAIIELTNSSRLSRKEIVEKLFELTSVAFQNFADEEIPF